jgi:hypothetical protein
MSIIQTKAKSSGFYRNLENNLRKDFYSLQRFEEGIFQRGYFSGPAVV